MARAAVQGRAPAGAANRHRLAHPLHVVLRREGTRIRVEDAETSMSWSVLRFHTETGRAFVPLDSYPRTTVWRILPKRALADAEEVDRLRALLGRHTTRLEYRRGRSYRIPPSTTVTSPEMPTSR